MPDTVLIAGATGLVGSAALARFLEAGDDNIIALSRRIPSVRSERPFTHLQLDLTDRETCAHELKSAAAVTHVVYAALYEKPGLVSGWIDDDQMATNDAMLRNLIDGLLAAGAPIRHVSIMQGTKAYGVHLQPIRIPAREEQPRVEHPNFYWLQQDYLADKAAESGFAYTVFRPQFIFGGIVGAAMNLIPVIAVYAAICREEGLPFSYPGGPSYVAEGVDSRIVANALFWAAKSPAAENQVFNITNGDVFEWRDLWPTLADELGTTAGPDRSLSVVEFLSGKEAVWQRIVKQYGLQATTLSALLGESHHYADFAFAHGVDSRDTHPAFVSTVKLRQAGFHDVMDTAETFRYWLRDLRERKVTPA